MKIIWNGSHENDDQEDSFSLYFYNSLLHVYSIYTENSNITAGFIRVSLAVYIVENKKTVLSLSSIKYIKENLVWPSHNFLLPYITVEEYFIVSITFIFNLYFLCFVVHELLAFIIIVCNF